MEENETYIIVEPIDGSIGISYCGNCKAVVPEPYHEQTKCENCDFLFTDMKTFVWDRYLSLDLVCRLPSINELREMRDKK